MLPLTFALYVPAYIIPATLVVYLIGHRFDVAAGVGGLVSGVWTAIVQTRRMKRNTALVLAGLDDVRVVGPMAEALDSDEEAISADAQERLIALLPRLRAEDTLLLSVAQQESICRAIPCFTAHFAEVAFAALRTVGDPAILPLIEDLAEGRAGALVLTLPMRNDARETAAVLRQRAEQRAAAGTLLRAADAPGDTLLRPAGAAQTDSGQLVRPAVQP